MEVAAADQQVDFYVLLFLQQLHRRVDFVEFAMTATLYRNL